jgi:hypothetical protein
MSLKHTHYTKEELEKLNFIDKTSYLCAICGYSTKHRNLLNSNKASHLPSVIKFKYSWCKKLYTRRDNLKRHSKNIHGFEEKIFCKVEESRPQNQPSTKACINKSTPKKHKFRLIMGKIGTPILKQAYTAGIMYYSSAYFIL